MTPAGPTARQLQVLSAIEDSVRRRGYPPSHRELCAELGLSRTSLNAIQELLHRLEGKGLLQRDAGVSRGMRITDAGHLALMGGRVE